MHIEKNENQPKRSLTADWVGILQSAEHYSALTNYVCDTFVSWEIFMSSGQVKK